MNSYALLIYRTSQAAVPATDERKTLAGHRELQGEAAAAGDLHAVARLAAPVTARSVKLSATGHDVTDGPYIESKEWLVGFYLIDCRSESEAVSRAKQICADPWHVIEVRPVDWRWHP